MMGPKAVTRVRRARHLPRAPDAGGEKYKIINLRKSNNYYIILNY